MDSLEELKAIEAIRDKQRRGEKLSDKDETTLAYSPLAAAGACECDIRLLKTTTRGDRNAEHN